MRVLRTEIGSLQESRISSRTLFFVGRADRGGNKDPFFLFLQHRISEKVQLPIVHNHSGFKNFIIYNLDRRIVQNRTDF